MQNLVIFLFHLAAAINFAYGIYYDLVELKLPDDYSKISIDFAGRWKYLTFWNMVYLMTVLIFIFLLNPNKTSSYPF